MLLGFQALLAPLVFFSIADFSGAEIESAPSGVSPAETQARVKMVKLREGTLPIALHALGQVSASRQSPATIMALAPGLVTQIPVHDGEEVSSGTTLVRLDERAARSELRKARSSLALAGQELQYGEKNGLSQQQTELELAAHQARVRAMQARQEHERLARLLAKSLISEKAATEARQAAETSGREADAAERKAADYGQSGKALDRARLRDKEEEARAALRLAELQVEALTVRAPLAGRVSRVHVAVGQSIDKGALLVELQAHAGAGALFALAPAQASRIQPGMAFRLVDAPGSRTFQGTILAVGGGVDAETGLVRVEGALDAGDGPAPYLGEILPGEIITGASPPGLLAPLGSLSLSDERAFVHQVDDKNQARLTAVEVLARGAESAVIRGPGLKSGARVIVEGNYNLPDGATVVAQGEP